METFDKTFREEYLNKHADFDSPEEAMKELHTSYELWKEISQEKGFFIPEPSNLKDYSGKFLLRIPKTLHKELTEKAVKENISLNQYVLYCLTRGIRA